MQVAARQLLSGTVQPPPEADILLRVLNSKVFAGNNTGGNYDDLYADVPVCEDDSDRQDDFSWNRDNRRNPERSELVGNPSRNRASMGNFGTTQQSSAAAVGRNRASTWGDDREYWERHQADPSTTFDDIERSVPQQQSRSARFQNRGSTYSDNPSAARSKGPPPGRPTAPKPVFKAPPKPVPGVANQAVALHTFAATQDGDLGFKKGDIITIVKRTDSKNVSFYCVHTTSDMT